MSILICAKKYGGCGHISDSRSRWRSLGIGDDHVDVVVCPDRIIQAFEMIHPLKNTDEILAGLPIKWDILKYDLLFVLLNHSDCDGSIQWQACEDLASRLEFLLTSLDPPWHAITKRFIKGLRAAALAEEDVEFA